MKKTKSATRAGGGKAGKALLRKAAAKPKKKAAAKPKKKAAAKPKKKAAAKPKKKAAAKPKKKAAAKPKKKAAAKPKKKTAAKPKKKVAAKPKKKAAAKPKMRAAAKPKKKAAAKPKKKVAAKPKKKVAAKPKKKVAAKPKKKVAAKPKKKVAAKPKKKVAAKPKKKVAAKPARASQSTAPARKPQVLVPISGNLQVTAEVGQFADWILEDAEPRLREVRTHVLRATAERLDQMSNLIEMALGDAWLKKPDVLTRLMGTWLKDRSARLRRLAVGAIPLGSEDRKTYDKSRRLLRGLVGDSSREVRMTAISVLSEDPDRNLDLVRKWVQSADAEVRCIATQSLHLAVKLKAILPLLRKLVVDSDTDVHWAAASVLYDIYDRSPKEVLEVGKVMAAHEDQDVRWAAAMSFCEHVFADGGEQVFSLMRQWSKSDDANLRWTLAHSLRFVPPDKTVVLLRNLMKHDDTQVRRRVMWQIWDKFSSFSNPHLAIELLHVGFQDPQPAVRQMARDAVEALGLEPEALQPQPRRGDRRLPKIPLDPAPPPPPFGDVS